MAIVVRAAGAVLGLTYSRYLLASVVALAVDTGLFFLFLSGGGNPMAASAIAYLAGVIVHWIVSTRFVFDDGMAATGAERVRQKGLFVATALLGLAITMAIIGGADWAGQDPRLAKLIAIVVSFQSTYIARRATIFR